VWLLYRALGISLYVGVMSSSCFLIRLEPKLQPTRWQSVAGFDRPDLPMSRYRVDVASVEPFRIALPSSLLPTDIIRKIIRLMATATPLEAIRALLDQLSMEERSEVVEMIQSSGVIIPQWWIPSHDIDHEHWRVAVDNWDAFHEVMCRSEVANNDLMETLDNVEACLELEPEESDQEAEESDEQPEGGEAVHDRARVVHMPANVCCRVSARCAGVRSNFGLCTLFPSVCASKHSVYTGSHACSPLSCSISIRCIRSCALSRCWRT
jgi:hypothetical protein